MSDYLSIQEIGGAELARHYPDRGLIPDSNWYNAVLHVELRAGGLRGWLNRLEVGSQAFGAVLSRNHDGLRVLICLWEFAIFIPWAEATVFAERRWAATLLRVGTVAIPSLVLEFNLDDVAADDLLRGVVEPLPLRLPPRRLAWWIADWWVAWAVLATGIGAGVIAWLALGKG
jgi:hypothetical protein